METQRQWCDQKSCPDRGKIGARNIKPYSHVERRYYCTTCTHTFSADRGTFFDTLRTDRHVLLDAVAMLVERNSLRAISRIKHCKPHTVLHWLDLAGQHAAAVSKDVIHGLHVTQVQIDELWTFIKKLDSGEFCEWLKLNTRGYPCTLGVPTHSVRQKGYPLAQAHCTAFAQLAGLFVWFAPASEQATRAACAASRRCAGGLRSTA
jgi:transposase-like protein